MVYGAVSHTAIQSTWCLDLGKELLWIRETMVQNRATKTAS